MPRLSPSQRTKEFEYHKVRLQVDNQYAKVNHEIASLYKADGIEGSIVKLNKALD